MSSKERPDADVVRALIESGAVNFDAIGSTLATMRRAANLFSASR